LQHIFTGGLRVEPIKVLSVAPTLLNKIELTVILEKKQYRNFK
jgi:hypothetical protein